MHQTRSVFCIYLFFFTMHRQILTIKAYMVSFGLKPRAAEWEVQMNPLSHWGHQCLWTLTPANSMQVSIMQFDDSNMK